MKLTAKEIDPLRHRDVEFAEHGKIAPVLVGNAPVALECHGKADEGNGEGQVPHE